MEMTYFLLYDIAVGINIIYPAKKGVYMHWIYLNKKCSQARLVTVTFMCGRWRWNDNIKKGNVFEGKEKMYTIAHVSMCS